MSDFQAEKRICQNRKNSFEIEAQDFAFYEKIKVPAPTWCPDCRFTGLMSSSPKKDISESLTHLYGLIKVFGRCVKK